MLHVYIKSQKDLENWENPEYLGKVSEYFNFEYEPEWFNDPFIKKIILEVDNTIVRNDGTLYSDALGAIVPKQLSTGCKALILCYKVNIKINGDRMGDNCCKLLLEISKYKDVYISLSHIMEFPVEFEIFLDNDNRILYSRKEFVSRYVNLIRR